MEIVETLFAPFVPSSLPPSLPSFLPSVMFLKTLMSNKWSFHFHSFILKCPSCCKTYSCVQLCLKLTIGLRLSVLLKMCMPRIFPTGTLHAIPEEAYLTTLLSTGWHLVYCLCQYYVWFSSQCWMRTILFIHSWFFPSILPSFVTM